MNSVTPGFRPDIDHRIADARRGAEEDLVFSRNADGHGVDQRVTIVGGVEIDLTAYGGDADTVAVAADAAHHPVDDALGTRVLRTAKPQSVQVGDGPSPHGEDVAQDSAHTGRRTLVWFDERRMVMALHLE